MKLKKLVAASVAAAAAVSLAPMLGGGASADPIAAPLNRALDGYGSDTTQDVMNGMGEVITRNGVLVVGSYNATGSATVPCDAATISRPNGSSAGINALNASTCVEFARSSRGPVDTSTTDLTWIPYALDAVAWVARDASPLDGKNPSLATLQGVYQCTINNIGGSPVVPVLPQAGSGTRAFWLEKMGMSPTLTDAQIASQFPCIVTGPGIQEHDGAPLAGSNTRIEPFSIAQWISQANGVIPDLRGTGPNLVKMQKINSVNPRKTDGTLNPSYPIRRNVYNVVRTAAIDDVGTDNANVEAVFDGPGKLLCLRTGIIRQYGFATISNCGGVGLKGER